MRRFWKFKRRSPRLAPVRATDRASGPLGPLRLGTRLAGAAFFLAAVWMPAQRSMRAQQGPTDSEVKAAYLFNFLKFVDWPDDAARVTQTQWVLGVVGDTPVDEDLKQLVTGKSIRGRELEVKNFTTIEDLRGCHILFIGASEKKRLPAILAGLHGSSVLTVADMDHFVESGGMIQFVIQDSRVRVAIDVGAASRAHLKVSSKLLSLAAAVIDSAAGAKN
ncbi:MAG: YfiR family protein [Acidobacteriia bacterium]|nr:YfiR family protein [Terriglobia bacterium]